MGIISKPNDPARDAANSLVSILNDNKIEARVGYPPFFLDEHGNPIRPTYPPSTGPPNVIIVEVGPKPLPISLQIKPMDIPADARGNRTWGNIAE